MKSKQRLKSLPKLKTDKAAEDFVRDADLTEYDLSAFKPMNFKFSDCTLPTEDC